MPSTYVDAQSRNDSHMTWHRGCQGCCCYELLAQASEDYYSGIFLEALTEHYIRSVPGKKISNRELAQAKQRLVDSPGYQQKSSKPSWVDAFGRPFRMSALLSVCSIQEFTLQECLQCVRWVCHLNCNCTISKRECETGVGAQQQFHILVLCLAFTLSSLLWMKLLSSAQLFAQDGKTHSMTVMVEEVHQDFMDVLVVDTS